MPGGNDITTAIFIEEAGDFLDPVLALIGAQISYKYRVLQESSSSARSVSTMGSSFVALPAYFMLQHRCCLHDMPKRIPIRQVFYGVQQSRNSKLSVERVDLQLISGNVTFRGGGRIQKSGYPKVRVKYIYTYMYVGIGFRGSHQSRQGRQRPTKLH